MTGSTTGLGLAAATLLAQAGADVWINGRTSDRIEAAIASIGDVAGDVAGACRAPPLYLADEDGGPAAMHRMRERGRAPALPVNSRGLQRLRGLFPFAPA